MGCAAEGEPSWKSKRAQKYWRKGLGLEKGGGLKQTISSNIIQLSLRASSLSLW